MNFFLQILQILVFVEEKGNIKLREHIPIKTHKDLKTDWLELKYYSNKNPNESILNLDELIQYDDLEESFIVNNKLQLRNSIDRILMDFQNS